MGPDREKVAAKADGRSGLSRRASAPQARPMHRVFRGQPRRMERIMARERVREGHSSGSIEISQAMLRWSPLCHWPESFVGMRRAVATFTMGGSAGLHFSECWATKRSWVPERFRGSCSFGGQ